MTILEHTAEIVSNKEVAPKTFLMGLRSREIAAGARPGQFVMLRVTSEADPLLRRPFSVFGTEDDRNLLLLYRVIGQGTRIMAQMTPGGRVRLMGPLGRGFEPPERGENALLVAGGIGLAPLVFLAHSLKERRTMLLAGYRTARDIVSPERLDLRAIPMSVATEDGSAGYQGLVTELLERALQMPGERIVYACGPMPMLKRVASMCLERGIACQVSLEASMACGLGACQGCAVQATPQTSRTYFQVCRDGPVFGAETLDWGVL